MGKANNIVWTEKYKPTSLSDVYLNENIRTLINDIIKTRKLKHIIINGSNGTGKTITAKLIIKEIYGDDYKDFLFINASDDRSFKNVKDKISLYCKVKVNPNIPKIIIFDEADKSIKKTQESINEIMDQYQDKLYIIFTCNDHNNIIKTIQSKCSIFRFPLSTDEHIRDKLIKIMTEEKIKYKEEGLKMLIYSCQGDMRQAINNLQKCSSDKITKNSVLLMCDLPDPEIVNTIIQFCKISDFYNASNELENMIKNGYAFTDIIRSFRYVILKYPYDIHEQNRLMEIIGVTQIQIAKELTSLLQLNAMLCRMVQMYSK